MRAIWIFLKSQMPTHYFVAAILLLISTTTTTLAADWSDVSPLLRPKARNIVSGFLNPNAIWPPPWQLPNISKTLASPGESEEQRPRLGSFSPIITTVTGFGSAAGGTAWQTQGHANWNVVQTLIANNPTEFQIYSNATQGIGRAIGGTDQIIRVHGMPFDPNWVGRRLFYFDGKQFEVQNVVDSSHLSVRTIENSVVKWKSDADGAYFYVVTSTDSRCTVDEKSVAYISGQPFIGFGSSLTVNGTMATVANFDGPTHITLSSPMGYIANGSCHQELDIAHELSTFRLQALAGGDEESFVITEAPAGVTMQTSRVGAGKYRPITLGTGEFPEGELNAMIQMNPTSGFERPGILSLGGRLGTESVRITSLERQLNYLQQSGAPTKVAPSLSARGKDDVVGLNLDTKGPGSINFSSHEFGATEFQILGNGGSSWLTVGSDYTMMPRIAATGRGADIGIVLAAKGAGQIYTPNTITLGSFTVATLPLCTKARQDALAVVTDADTPLYNAPAIGGGANHVLVLCFDHSWRFH